MMDKPNFNPTSQMTKLTLILNCFFRAFIYLLFKIELYIATIFAFVCKDSSIPSKPNNSSSMSPIGSIMQITYLHFSAAFRAFLRFTHNFKLPHVTMRSRLLYRTIYCSKNLSCMHRGTQKFLGSTYWICARV
jgi:hypothetical protein